MNITKGKNLREGKKSPFPGTRGYGSCNSNALLNKTGIGAQLLKFRSEKRKRECCLKKADRNS